METEIRHIVVRVFGHVQGVGLRYAIMHKAQDLKLSGYVKNMPENSEVMFEAQGRKSDLEELINWVRKGPAWSQIDNFDVQEKPLEELGIFRIEYK